MPLRERRPRCLTLTLRLPRTLTLTLTLILILTLTLTLTRYGDGAAPGRYQRPRALRRLAHQGGGLALTLAVTLPNQGGVLTLTLTLALTLALRRLAYQG